MWVSMTAAAVLPSDGPLPATTTIELCEGWNLIGFPAAEPRHPYAALASIAGKWPPTSGGGESTLPGGAVGDDRASGAAGGGDSAAPQAAARFREPREGRVHRVLYPIQEALYDTTSNDHEPSLLQLRDSGSARLAVAERQAHELLDHALAEASAVQVVKLPLKLSGREVGSERKVDLLQCHGQARVERDVSGNMAFYPVQTGTLTSPCGSGAARARDVEQRHGQAALDVMFL